jgi:hypothetical protein
MWPTLGEHYETGPQLANCRDSDQKLGSGRLMGNENAPVDPNRLTPEKAAKILSAAAKIRIPAEQIVRDLDDSAPQNTDGTLNLVHYAAWLLKEMGRGD